MLDDRSLNGIFLNGERIEWGDLSDGDELMIGRYRLFFVDDGEPASTSDDRRPSATGRPPFSGPPISVG